MSETEEELHQAYRDTWKRAKDNGVDYIWSGDLRRNKYLRHCLNYGIDNKIIVAEYVEGEQESGYNIKYQVDTDKLLSGLMVKIINKKEGI